MRFKFIALIILAIALISCSGLKYGPEFAPEKTMQKVLAHRVAIATYYEMSEQEYLRRTNMTKQVKNYQDVPIFITYNETSQEVTVAYLGSSSSIPTYFKMPEKEYLARVEEIKHTKDYLKIQNVPIFVKKDEKTDTVTVAYLGAGMIIKDNHIITVNHLFDEEHSINTYSMNIWVFKENVDHPIPASVVVRTQCELITRSVHFNDYAVIEMGEDLGLPGLKIAKPGTLKMGDRVIFTGSTGGLAFFTRFGYITKLKNYFEKDIEGKLELGSWEDFAFWTVYPGGPGDSGGSVTNIRGEIVTIMYCGITVYSEEYIFGNPTQMIWDFLEKYNLQHLAR